MDYGKGGERKYAMMAWEGKEKRWKVERGEIRGDEG